jgi:hypothetical protein
MEEKEDFPREGEFQGEGYPEPVEDECGSIQDPVRRSLCRVCKAPVIGEAPFCKDHEPPVP